jgi:hypothetical protein
MRDAVLNASNEALGSDPIHQLAQRQRLHCRQLDACGRSSSGMLTYTVLGSIGYISMIAFSRCSPRVGVTTTIRCCYSSASRPVPEIQFLYYIWCLTPAVALGLPVGCAKTA